MFKRDTDINLLRSRIDLSEAECQHNTDQDNKIHANEQGLVKCRMHIQWLQNRLQEVQAQLTFLKTENFDLRMVNSSQANTIAELQCWVDPYSEDGAPVCNAMHVLYTIEQGGQNYEITD